MKKLRTGILITILSTTLVANAFGGSSVAYGFIPFFDATVNTVVSYFISGTETDNCPVRVCGNCRPEDSDPNGDCRPTAK